MRVIVAHDQPLYVEGIKAVLERSGDVDVVAEVAKESGLLPTITRTRPDAVLLGFRHALPVLQNVRLRHPDVKVLALLERDDREQLALLFRHGASACVLKSIDPRDLPAALRQAFEGTVYHALGPLEAGEDSTAKAAGLTDREFTVLKGVARGLSNEAIGKELWVTEQTVKFHLTNIYRKLSVANRTEATRYAYQNGLVATAA
jgi:DNA-binding NarL/FixJ family response regulator